LAQPRELLQRPSTVIFEAALGHGPFYILVDILVKDVDTLTLIEVKSKKYEADDSFFKKRVPHHLLDVAFENFGSAADLSGVNGELGADAAQR